MMLDIKDSLKTFDPSEIEEVIENLKKSEFKHLQGEIRFELSGSLGILIYEASAQDRGRLLKRDSDAPPSSGFFLLFPRHDLVQLVKRVFDLREKSE